MLGFTLSKLNLLLLAIAASATMAYFMIIYIDVSEAQAAQQLAQKLAQDSASLVNSATYCDYLEFPLPNALAVGGKEFYYSVKISALLSPGEAMTKNYLIFSIIRKRAGQKSIVATSSAISSAEIRIFRFIENDVGLGVEEVADIVKEGAILDPQASPKENIVMLVKEIISGKAIIYVIPCSSDSDVCVSNKSSAANKIGRPGGFNC